MIKGIKYLFGENRPLIDSVTKKLIPDVLGHKAYRVISENLEDARAMVVQITNPKTLSDLAMELEKLLTEEEIARA